ncbi:MAG: hypothetical protein HY036_03510 [Nitrospirae bacterium]|nr:hypothetical protein [Nitrospirota bacterium]
MNLPLKVILILANQPELVQAFKNKLQKETSDFYVAKNVHEAVIQVVLAEPDIVLIEVTPKNFSGLQLPEILSQIKGLKPPPSFLLIADKRHRESLNQKFDSIFYVDDRKLPILFQKMIPGTDAISEKKEEKITSFVQKERPFETYPPQDRERKILEKLDQLGIIRRK